MMSPGLWRSCEIGLALPLIFLSFAFSVILWNVFLAGS